MLRTFIPIILLEQAKQINFTKIISEEFVVSYDLNPFRDAKKICTCDFFFSIIVAYINAHAVYAINYFYENYPLLMKYTYVNRLVIFIRALNSKRNLSFPNPAETGNLFKSDFF